VPHSIGDPDAPWPDLREAPTLHARSLPAYPQEATDDLVALAGVARGGAVLEAGPGTGQLNVPLLERGLRVTALEPGPRMAGLLNRRVAAHPPASVLVARFNTAVRGSRLDGEGRTGGAFTEDHITTLSVARRR